MTLQRSFHTLNIRHFWWAAGNVAIPFSTIYGCLSSNRKKMYLREKGGHFALVGQRKVDYRMENS